MNTKIAINVWTAIINWLAEEDVEDVVDVAVVDVFVDVVDAVVVDIFVVVDAVVVDTVVLEILRTSILSKTCSHNNILSSI